MSQVKERPILVTGQGISDYSLAEAILLRRKTQTRRIVKPKPVLEPGKMTVMGRPVATAYWHYKGAWWWETPQKSALDLCPFGRPGDRLWVKETWAAVADYDEKPPRDIPHDATLQYRADKADRLRHHISQNNWGRWRSSIHMPRWASRITLEVTGVRLERVQQITLEDCLAEGIPYQGPEQIKAQFINLWDSLNEDRGYGWETNPWVWVVEFELVKG